jgi:putative chitobiose transport system permease protein
MSRIRRELYGWMFLLPATLLLFLFTLYPIAVGTLLAFFKYDLLQPPKFVGFENFALMLRDRFFWIALKNSLLYILVVPILQFIALLVAVGLSRAIWGRNFFKVALYVPAIMSTVVIGIVWRWLLDQKGVLNYLLLKLGMIEKPIAWLASPNFAIWAVMAVTIWRGIGFYALIYLAALQAQPIEYQEAAMVDGATSSQVFWKITVPLLRPAILFATTISLIAALKVFEEIYVLTGGGPIFSTYTMMLFIFEKAFVDLNLGYAAAIGVVLAAFIALFSVVNFRIFKEGGYERYE